MLITNLGAGESTGTDSSAGATPHSDFSTSIQTESTFNPLADILGYEYVYGHPASS